VDSVPDPLLLRKFGSAGNQICTSGSVDRNSATRPQRRFFEIHFSRNNEKTHNLMFEFLMPVTEDFCLLTPFGLVDICCCLDECAAFIFTRLS
jgi:hypothetical protein